MAGPLSPSGIRARELVVFAAACVAMMATSQEPVPGEGQGVYLEWSGPTQLLSEDDASLVVPFSVQMREILEGDPDCGPVELNAHLDLDWVEGDEAQPLPLVRVSLVNPLTGTEQTTSLEVPPMSVEPVDLGMSLEPCEESPCQSDLEMRLQWLDGPPPPASVEVVWGVDATVYSELCGEGNASLLIE